MKTLTTDRLILRQWELTDLDDLHQYCKSPVVGPMAGWASYDDRDEALKYLKATMEQGDTWALVLKEENRVIGSVGLHKNNRTVPSRDLGYVMHEDYWGKGLMTEAVGEVLRFAFTELALELVAVAHADFNFRSAGVINKNRFRLEGIKKNSFSFEGKSCDSLCYSLTKAEWLNEGGRPLASYRFYQNRACKYFPCHKTNDLDGFSCQFCYCPLYFKGDCGGNYTLLENGVKDCSHCLRPHFCYDDILKGLYGN